MAYNKADKADSPMKRRGGMRRRKSLRICGKDNTIDYKDVNKLKDMYLKEERFFLAVSQETVQSIRELLQLLLREHVT